MIVRLDLDSAGRIVAHTGLPVLYASPWPTPSGWANAFHEPAWGMVLHTEAQTEALTRAQFQDRALDKSAFCSVGADGRIFQYGPVGHSWAAWTQAAGNLRWRGVEFTDDGDPATPLTGAQVETAAELFELFSRQDSFPLQATDDPAAGRGLILHSDGGIAWGDHPDCPGPVRAAQRDRIVARAEQIRQGALLMLTMFDAIYTANLPATTTIAGAYVGGRWPTFTGWTDASGYHPPVSARFPHARILSIAINASEDADCLDVEQFDATPDQAPTWVRRQQARGVYRPVIYTSQANLGAVMGYLTGAGISRAEVRLWSAHYAGWEHNCAPDTCQAALPVDGTQWQSTNSFDQSTLLPNFFDLASTPPPAATPEDPMFVIANTGQSTLLVTGGLVIVLDDGPDVDYWVKASGKLLRDIPADAYAKFRAHAV